MKFQLPFQMYFFSESTLLQKFLFKFSYFYPRQLLSQQFWHPDQKKEFVLEEYEKRSQYYLPLIKEVGVTAKENNNKDLLKFCLQVGERISRRTNFPPNSCSNVELFPHFSF